MDKLQQGVLLIAEPFLADTSFQRAVVLLCEHESEGSFGLIINKKADLKLHEVIDDVENENIELYYGGPVNLNTIHFIHQLPELIPNGIEIGNNIYWGGAFDDVIRAIQHNKLDLSKIKFFIGYSGWSKNQLQNEINETNSWLITLANATILFNTATNILWKKAVQLLDKKYATIANYPINPQLN
jgi:putative transcriptional regulator